MTKAFNWQQVIKILGVLLMIEALFMAIAAIVAYIYGGDDFTAIAIKRASVIKSTPNILITCCQLNVLVIVKSRKS